VIISYKETLLHRKWTHVANNSRAGTRVKGLAKSSCCPVVGRISVLRFENQTYFSLKTFIAGLESASGCIFKQPPRIFLRVLTPIRAGARALKGTKFNYPSGNSKKGNCLQDWTLPC
jgi:hypothetical protein